MTGNEAVAALPGLIRVGPHDFRIVKDDILTAASKTRWGECSSMLQQINIQSDMPTPMKAVETFLHEAMHACFWAYGILDEDKEERTVSALGTALLALHRDNPWLAGWITRALDA